MKRPSSTGTSARTITALTIVLLAAAAWAFQAKRDLRARDAAPASMAAMLPQGALLTIQSPDFAALLKSWNDSPTQKAWLSSANYSVFQNSRLFGRLNDARSEFESATGEGAKALSIDGDLLTQVAGRQSIFAWYDVGKLEFVYITRLSSAQAAASALMRQRGSFSAREAAGSTFYLRRSTDSESGATRTVAFAQVADAGASLLVLATREDLMADALTLIQRASVHEGAGLQALDQEPWYAEASAALTPGSAPPVLHMMLNLDRLVPLPAFRTYWVQQNITAMKQYRAAAADLYREPGLTGERFREERALLLKAPETAIAEADLASMAALIPPDAGMLRATATHDPEYAARALEERLLGRETLPQDRPPRAPNPMLAAAPWGSAADLETYIDDPAPALPASSKRSLAHALDPSGFDAVLTFSSASSRSPDLPWVSIHSAVVLHSPSGWQEEAVLHAIQEALRGDLTTSTLGLEFQPANVSGQSLYALTGPKSLYLAVRGGLWLLADDEQLLLTMLQRAPGAAASHTRAATSIAEFSLSSQRGPFARLTSLVDGTNGRPALANTDAGARTSPAFFSQNIASLAETFAGLSSEHVTERREGSSLRQTVTYEWQR